MQVSSLHKFHIPVMGLAYTIDSPIKVAHFGIASVMSIVEDGLVEMMRKHYYNAIQEPFEEIPRFEPDYRAKRITDYLNLVNKIVQQKLEKVKQAAFEAGSEIVQYFEMLPNDHALKQVYNQMLQLSEKVEQLQLQNYLRSQVVAGSIDVNIMTKLDNEKTDKNGNIIEDGSEAVAALRGYANSNLTHSAIVFSAGMNPRLYNYLEKCDAFDADENGYFKKRVIIKVSDYRSALIQGKYLAKKGIWVSEFRIESGLNCGGHAFATDGILIGPILEEFKQKKNELIEAIFLIYNTALAAKGKRTFAQPHSVSITAQGGIGTNEEASFLEQYYDINGTGWGTPFLLVPEATTVDEQTLSLLQKATEKDVLLSKNSPLGVHFHYLKGTTSDVEKNVRICNGKPGSPCSEKHLAFNTEFTDEPICTASIKYQRLKIADLQSKGLPTNEYNEQLTEVLDKECLCVGLSNAASIVYNVPFVKNQNAVNICPGPNIVNFSKVVSLATMVDHIYGRTNIIDIQNRPHLFIAELKLYIQYIKKQIEKENNQVLDNKRKKYYQDFYKNLMSGIQYYRELVAENIQNHSLFIQGLDKAETEIHLIFFQFSSN